MIFIPQILGTLNKAQNSLNLFDLSGAVGYERFTIFVGQSVFLFHKPISYGSCDHDWTIETSRKS